MRESVGRQKARLVPRRRLRAASPGWEADELAAKNASLLKVTWGRLGLIAFAALWIWLVLEAFPAGGMRVGLAPGGLWMRLGSPIVEPSGALSAVMAMQGLIVTLSVAIVVGVRLDGASPENLLRLSSWFESASTVAAVLAAVSLSIGVSLVVHESWAARAWVVLLVAILGVVVAAATYEDGEAAMKIREAMRPLAMQRQRAIRERLSRWGVDHRPVKTRPLLAYGALVVVGLGVELVALVISDAAWLSSGYLLAIMSVSSVLWVTSAGYLLFTSAAVWLLRGIGARAAEVARWAFILVSVAFIAPALLNAVAGGWFLYWCLLFAPPFTSAAVLSALPSLRGWNPYFVTAWVAASDVKERAGQG